jgi:hypothetical protein
VTLGAKVIRKSWVSHRVMTKIVSKASGKSTKLQELFTIVNLPQRKRDEHENAREYRPRVT